MDILRFRAVVIQFRTVIFHTEIAMILLAAMFCLGSARTSQCNVRVKQLNGIPILLFGMSSLVLFNQEVSLITIVTNNVKGEGGLAFYQRCKIYIMQCMNSP